MFKHLGLTIFFSLSLFGANFMPNQWKPGLTFSHYLDKHHIPKELLDNISAEDTKFLSDIQSGVDFYESYNGKELEEALIPINEEMEIRLFKEEKTDKFIFDIIPIEYKEKEYFATVDIETNPYSDTLMTVKNQNIAKRVSQALKNKINTKKLAKGDKFSFNYVQKTRFDNSFGMPDIKVIKLVTRGKTKFIYVDGDGDGHTNNEERTSFSENGDFIHLTPFKDTSKTLQMPLRHVRITSNFTLRRYHPILKRYRPHHGTDFGAKKGTPLLAVYDGKVSFAGWMNGYGNVVKIKHPMGFESLYAHQSKMKVKKGQRVKKGQIIGYVGSTGRSTGPHLHFGLMKNNKWVNPMKHLKKTTFQKERYTKTIIKDAKKYEEKLNNSIKNKEKTYVWFKRDQKSTII